MTQREFDAVCPRVSPTACCVYIALVTCRNARTGVTPMMSHRLIEHKTGKSNTRVRAAIKELVVAGFLTVVRHQRGCVYGFPTVF